MAFHGDCSSYPVPDLLQWVDTARKTGSLTFSADRTHRRVFTLGGQLVATAGPGLWERLARVLALAGLTDGQGLLTQLRGAKPLSPVLASVVQRLAQEELVAVVGELMLAGGAQFHFTEDPDRGDDEWVPIEVSAQELLFDALRQLDEAQDVDSALLPQAQLTSLSASSTESVVQQVVMAVVGAQPGISVQQLWLQVGLGRRVVTRAVFDLVRSNALRAEGAAPLSVDPVAQMLENGAVLVREKQFDAASLVFSALLKRDPTDRRVRAFARLAERQTFEQMQAAWDVTAIVLASGQREVEALKRLQKLIGLGYASVRQSS